MHDYLDTTVINCGHKPSQVGVNCWDKCIGSYHEDYNCRL